MAFGLVLIEPLFGAQFGDARLALLLLAPGIIARGPWTVAVQVLLARGRGRELARLNTFTLGAGLPLRIAGTLAFGIEGAALTSSIVYVGQALAGARLLLGRPHPNG